MSKLVKRKPNFYPTDKKTGATLKLRLNRWDRTQVAAIRGRGLKGIVTDLLTNKQYKIYGKSCGCAGCWCDSFALEFK